MASTALHRFYRNLNQKVVAIKTLNNFNGNNINGAIHSSYIVSVSGTYGIIVQDAYDCFNSTVIDVSKIECNLTEISVYPNPAEKIVHINWCSNVDARLNCMDGKLIRIIKSVNEVNIEDLPNGLYLLSLFDEHQQRTTIVISKIEK